MTLSNFKTEEVLVITKRQFMEFYENITSDYDLNKKVLDIRIRLNLIRKDCPNDSNVLKNIDSYERFIKSFDCIANS